MLSLLIAPDFPPEFFANWHMFNTQLQRALDATIHLQIPTGYREQQTLIDSETIALVYANPLDANSLITEKGYIPLAKPDLPSEQVLVVAPADSAIAALSDLPADSRVLITANHDSEAIALDVLQGTAITADSVQWLPTRTFPEIARRLMANEAEIGLLLARSFRSMNASTQGSLKILFETEFNDFGHIMLLHPDFAAQADTLRAALVNMVQSPVNKMTLEDLGLPKGFVAVAAESEAVKAAEVEPETIEPARAETTTAQETAEPTPNAESAETAELTETAKQQPENEPSKSPSGENS